MMQDYLTIALSKGTLLKPTLKLLEEAGMPVEGVTEDSRAMVFNFEEEKIRYIMCRPTDVPTYVEQGAADLGIVGKDVIVEQGKDVYELLDLGYGYCRFVVAVPREKDKVNLRELNYKRAATKFPVVAENFFRSQGLQVEIIKLHGNVELAPIMGIADMIVDIVSTGRTLRENNLVELVKIMDSTTRLICNRVSYRTKYDQIRPLLESFAKIIEKGGNK
ncbi:ATP phosphoribosyltransferase catalytic subunit [Thermosyntropha lipolytica DSM 11003]|uniref:ATP phosphoribosyltransferase n=1 Tax=Thermosyntropha lipolytica DSM 11003 TaxID=1123382 RepID=A0A1M5J9U2_9FIRM|nr:ATP phosphoribosyltransferase [Thermosyntropha lipolytica]SHG37089.1 ATP phosphoribosyltransferase catalytic subunit [Thermosyntropha lipolytica DSM 11003]